MAQAPKPKREPAGQPPAAEPPPTDLLEAARKELSNARALMRQVPLPRTVEPVTVFRIDA
jgi:hypothetical protein